jgi:hypothetical protein
MGNVILRKHGASTTICFELYALDGTALSTSASHAVGDTTISKNESNFANTASGFVDRGPTYSLALSATEMQAARIMIALVDQSSPQVWLDKTVYIETYGNASAQHAFDLGTATQSVNVASTSDIDFSATQKSSLNASTPTVDVDESALAAAVMGSTVENTMTVTHALQVMLAVLAGKLSGGGTATVTFRDTGDSVNRVIATVDSAENRTAITLNPT